MTEKTNEVVTKKCVIFFCYRSVYPDFHRFINDNAADVADYAILAPLNETVDEINTACINLFPGEEKTYQSIDTIKDEDAAHQFPPELLNSLSPPGLPPHELRIKTGVPLMLLRNLDPPKLCNGTKLIVLSAQQHVLETKIAAGVFKGEHVFIPRISLENTEGDLPFAFRRLQFPVRICFAMTIHKAQGQSLNTYGIELGTPCFQHGQLYVALGRAVDKSKVKIRAPAGKTKNVVLKGALKVSKVRTQKEVSNRQERKCKPRTEYIIMDC